MRHTRGEGSLLLDEVAGAEKSVIMCRTQLHHKGPTMHCTPSLLLACRPPGSSPIPDTPPPPPHSSLLLPPSLLLPSSSLLRAPLPFTQVVVEGEEGDYFYIILEGEAVVYQSSAQGLLKVNHLFRADFFGERALLSNEPR